MLYRPIYLAVNSLGVAFDVRPSITKDYLCKMEMFFHQYFLFWFFQLIFSNGVLCFSQTEVTVTTKVGTYIGRNDIVQFDGENKTVTQFLGIPYAKPPVGKRRFARPEPFGPFSHTYNATFHRAHCLQLVPPYYMYLKDYEKDEDCLYLNLYIPGNQTSTDNKFAVMIYIHGGSFALGGADIHSGDTLSSFNDVIVVVINYRLNVFGFLSNGTTSSGNFGLWDMRMAIQWVHDHISAFGGDPGRVTLFGNSAGGSGVMFQATYPKNKGLFQRIITQSGTSLAYFAFQKNPTEVFMQYIVDIGCNSEAYERTIECLRNKPAAELQTGSWEFLPSVDRDFVLETPAKLFDGVTLASKTAMEFFGELDLINGVTSSDGAMYIPTWRAQLEAKNIDIDNGVPRSFFVNTHIPEVITRLLDTTSDILTESVVHQYTDWTRPDDTAVIRKKMIDLESDVAFFVPAMMSSLKHSEMVKNGQKGRSYFYVFDNKPSFIPEPNWLKGATHTMEVAYIFGLHESIEGKLTDDLDAIDPWKVTQEDIKLAKTMMAIWSNFAKDGQPNIPLTTMSVNWPTFDSNEQKYLNLTVNMTSESARDHLAATRVAFWKDLFPVLGKCNNDSRLTSDGSISSSYLASVFMILFVVNVIM